MCAPCQYLPAVTAFSPYANSLVLIGQVLTALKVEGLHGLRVFAEKVLSATVRSQIGEIAGILSDLYAPLTTHQTGAFALLTQLEGQIVATIGRIHVH